MAKLTLVTGSDDQPMPPDLGVYGKSLWSRVMAEYDLQDVGGVELLRQACRALDRAESCRAIINKDGEVIRVKHGPPREHPLLKHELANRAFVARTLSRLGLDVEPIRSVGRPPVLA